MAGIIKRMLVIIVIVASLFFLSGCWSWMINKMMPSDSRPGKISYPVQKVTDQEFEEIATDLTVNKSVEFKYGGSFFLQKILRLRSSRLEIFC